MTTTYTTSLRLWEGQPQDPAIRNAWGTAINENQVLLESAILGTAVIAIGGLLTYTLTIANGAADQARPYIQSYTGTLTAACTVTLPNVPKIGWAQNATTGGFNVVLTTGTGTTVTIPADSAFYWYMVDSVGNVTLPSFSYGALVSSSLKVTGNATVGGTLVVTGLLTASDGLTVTTGGITVTAGGITITLGGATITAGGLTVAAGGANITGGLSTDTLTIRTGLPPGINYGDIKDSGIAIEAFGWRLCWGQTRPRTDPLWVYIVAQSISWPWGNGDGSTTYTMPDFRGRGRFGQDNMGGTAANRITAGVSGIAGTTLGAAGGDQHAQTDTITTVLGGGLALSGSVTLNDEGHSHSLTGGFPISGPGNQISSFNPTFELGGDSTNTVLTGITLTNTLGIVNNLYAASSSSLTGASQNMPPAAIVSALMYVGA